MSRLFDDAAGDFLAGGGAVRSSPPFTVSVWARTDDSADDQQVAFAIGQAGVDNHFWRFRSDPVGGDVSWRAEEEPDDGAARTTTGMSANTWHHLAAVEAAADDHRAYIDGGSKGTSSSSAAPSGVDDTWIGQNDDGGPAGDRWSGDLAHCAVWSAALTDQEIASLAAGVSPLRIRRDSLIAYWPVNGQGTEPNVVGTGFDMTPTGTTKSEEPPISSAIVAP